MQNGDATFNQQAQAFVVRNKCGVQAPNYLMFKLSPGEWNDLKCPNGISIWGGELHFPAHCAIFFQSLTKRI